MGNRNLLKENVKKLGYPLFDREEGIDANTILADVVKSKDIRMWEGFPVLLANSAEKRLLDFSLLEHRLRKSSDKLTLQLLTSLSLALYEYLDMKFSWPKQLYMPLSLNRGKINKLIEKFERSEEVKVTDKLLSTERLIKSFKNYFKHEEPAKLAELIASKEEFDLEYAMSQIFSPGQKELFLKKLRGEKMTKTEKEYYSRAVKKKVLALANSELYKLAQKAL
jgi:hypothetical protein